MSGQKTDNLLKAIAKGGIIIFIGSIIGKIFRFIFFICLIRVLGASLYGLYSIGQSIIDIVTNVSLLGDGRGFIRFAASYYHGKDTLRLKGMIQGYIFICLLLSFIIGILLFFGSGYLSSQLFHSLALAGVLKIFALSFPFLIFALIVVPVGYAFQRMEYKVIMQEVAQPIINIIVVGIIFILGGRLYGAVSGFFISSVITAILGFYLLKKLYLENTSESGCVFETKKLIIYSLPLIGVIFCYYLLFRLDRIILGIYRSPFEVGIYSAASNTAIGILAFSSIFEASFTPVITQLYHSNNKEELKKIYNCVTSWGACMTFIPCIALIIFNKEIVFLFGKNLTSAEPMLILLSVSLFLEIVPGQLRQLFQLSSHQNIEFINSVLMILLNIGLNLILVPIFGGIGAAYAFLFTVITISLVRIIELKIIFGFLPFSSRYLKILSYISSAIIVSFLSLASSSLILKFLIAVFILIFFPYLIFKLRSKEDMAIWNLLKSKLVSYGIVN